MAGTDGRIAQANGRLKASKVGMAIEQIGDRLALRATLPPKPSSDRPVAYQQRIFLGFLVNPNGIRLAEAEARKIGALLDCKEFDWLPYLTPVDVPSSTVATWISKFEQDYFSRRARSPKTETTWKKDYLAVFARLPGEEEITAELLTAAVLETAPDTRTRKRFCIALGALANFAQLGIDLKPLAGSYSPKQVTPRDLPDDRAIAEWFRKIPDLKWQWVYGMLATYGLRPHEIFHLSFDDMPIVRVLDGKTGARTVWPCFPEWVHEFDLMTAKIPNVTGKDNSALGERGSRYFRRIGIPFQPYDLRHAWAIRTLEFGLDISLAAQQMGHSVQVHSSTYHQWITHRHHQKAYELIMMRSDRPLPPKLDYET